MTGRDAIVQAVNQTTVAIDSGRNEGTGFFVGPGLVLTCAHVLCGPGDPPPATAKVRWRGEEFTFEVVED